MNEIPPHDQAKLSEIVALFTEAEEAIKYIEDFGENLIVPAVNQLRYAGNHLVRYLSSSAEVDELRDAEKHAKRATYDAYEAAIFYHLLEYNKFHDDYRKVVISQVIPNYSDIQISIESSRSFVRANGGSKTRGENYKDGRTHLEKLINETQKLSISRDELNKLMKKERNTFMWMVLGGMATIAALAVGVLQYIKCP